MESPPLRHVNVALPVDIYEALKRDASKNHRSLKQQVMSVLTEYIEPKMLKVGESKEVA